MHIGWDPINPQFSPVLSSTALCLLYGQQILIRVWCYLILHRQGNQRFLSCARILIINPAIKSASVLRLYACRRQIIIWGLRLQHPLPSNCPHFLSKSGHFSCMIYLLWTTTRTYLLLAASCPSRNHKNRTSPSPWEWRYWDFFV